MRSASDSDEDVVELHSTETAHTSASNATDSLTDLDKVAGDDVARLSITQNARLRHLAAIRLESP